VRKAAAICAALALDALVGDPARLHPVAGFGRVAAALERLLWRDRRGFGTLFAALLVGGTYGGVRAAERRLVGSQRFVFAVLVLWSTLGGRSLARYALELARAVERGDLARARALAPALVGRDPSRLDAQELCRAAVESVAENTTDAIVAPIGWFALLGPAGAAGYRAANTLDAMVGYRSPRYVRFGWASARLDDVVTSPWARVATVAAAALARAVGGSWRTSVRALPAARHHPSPNAGLIEAAFAGALAVRLGGRNDYDGRIEKRPSLGAAERSPAPADIQRAVRLSRAVTAATALAAGALSRG
jgi:adenosylcobinamide-phosphate synthase